MDEGRGEGIADTKGDTKGEEQKQKAEMNEREKRQISYKKGL
jgi:hypothetical protein